MERKKLMESQTQLILTRMREATAVIQGTTNMICKELGVPENELGLWRLSNDKKYFEKIKMGKQKPIRTFPRKKKK
ncbi:unnamed protein product [marine sediment metagenome]|uniref:Uncharacterized protein n=1 Tax=marine sediment metagenome TaxID=412755 RepID=X1BVI3_9ZZZZ